MLGIKSLRTKTSPRLYRPIGGRGGGQSGSLQNWLFGGGVVLHLYRKYRKCQNVNADFKRLTYDRYSVLNGHLSAKLTHLLSTVNPEMFK